MPIKKLALLFLSFFICSCAINKKVNNTKFTLAFGSCNNQNEENLMWNEISKNNPDVFVWGGDIVYADHESGNMDFLAETYSKQKAYPEYKKFAQSTEIIGTWDDHDYGINDGGTEFAKKAESQQLFLDFMDVDQNSPRRKQKSIYHSNDYQIGSHSVKILSLDTRYFRTALTKDPNPSIEKRFMPNIFGDGTMLGESQWQWLENQLNSSIADFNIINSSIQFISPYHGFEKWANMPHEVVKMESLIKSSQAKNVIILSGDRHISEFSRKQLDGLDYPLIDFTSSGLNRGLNRFKNEENPYRVGANIVVDSFGLLHLDFDKQQVIMEIRGVYNKVLHRYVQNY